MEHFIQILNITIWPLVVLIILLTFKKEIRQIISMIGGFEISAGSNKIKIDLIKRVIEKQSFKDEKNKISKEKTKEINDAIDTLSSLTSTQLKILDILAVGEKRPKAIIYELRNIYNSDTRASVIYRLLEVLKELNLVKFQDDKYELSGKAKKLIGKN